MVISSYKWFLSKRFLPAVFLLLTISWQEPASKPSAQSLVLLSVQSLVESQAGLIGGAGAGRAGAVFHPFYVSVTEINHNAKDKILEISCKLFTNDFEAVLEKNLHARIDLSSPANKKACDGYIAAYVVQNLLIKVDGKPVALQFVGSEKEQDATWSYFQVNNIPAVKKIDITNSLLYDGFDKEINIMHVSVGGERKSGKLDYPETGITFQW